MTLLKTERLALSLLSYDDSAFIIELLNEPCFKRFIGDKNVQNDADARHYLRDGPLLSYQQNGFGMYLVRNLESGRPLGMCGLIKRDELEVPDLGFAFLQRYHALGYASEATDAVLDFARSVLRLPRIIAIVNPHNVASIRLIEKAGLSFEKRRRLQGENSDIYQYSMVIE